PWRFNLPRSWDDDAPVVAHTVLDRTLVRAGETVSMKHFIRREMMEGLVGVKAPPVFEAVVTHVGSGQTYTLPLEWSEEGGYARYALSRFAVPPAAKLGQYRIELRWNDEGRAMALSSGQF